MRKSRIWIYAIFLCTQIINFEVYIMKSEKSEIRAKNKSDRLKNEKVWKLMLTMGIPMILSMMVQALYNIVDSAFVSNMTGGDNAFNALTLAFPVQMLIIAISIGTGVGVNALVSRYLGEGDKEKASKVAGNGVFLAACIYVVFLLFGIFGTSFYVSTQTANAEVQTMTTNYLRICCIFSFGNTFYAIYEKLLQATGKSMLSTLGQIAGALANIILDPIFIYDWGLGLGVEGAAWATIIGQILSFVLDFIFHLKFNKDISNKLNHIKPSGKLIGRIYAIGLPAIIAQALMSVMTYGMNLILGGLDKVVYDTENAASAYYNTSPYVNAYGLYYKIQQFILFAAFGLRDAITPIVSYSYGMGSKKRVKDGIKYGMLYTAIVMIIGTAILETCAKPLSGAFGGLSEEAQTLCVSAMRVISVSFLFAGACVALQGVFQATNGNVQSLVISILRQAVFVLPVAYAFSVVVKNGSAGSELIWCTFIISEVLTSVVGFILLRMLYKKKIAPLGEVVLQSDEAEAGAAEQETETAEPCADAERLDSDEPNTNEEQ